MIEIHDTDGKGAAWARNEGFKYCESPFVLFSDDDIYWHHQALEVMVQALENHPETSFSFGSYLCDGHLVGRPFRWDVHELYARNYISTMSLIRSEHFPGFDQQLDRLQDWDLWLTMVEAGHQGIYCMDQLFCTGIQEGDISSTGADVWQQALERIQEKHGIQKTDIIIPNYALDQEMDHLAAKCLESIRLYTENYRVILVDNGSQFTRWTAQEFKRLPSDSIWIQNSENIGFVKGINQGLAESTAPFVCFLNNDCEVTAYWLDQLKWALNPSDVGLAGPRTDANGSWQGREKARQEIIILKETQMLAFFCVLIKRQVIHQLGGLDEGFGIGFGDDDDYCKRATQAGWKMAFNAYAFVKHHHRSTFKKLFSLKQIQVMQQKALARFRNKHGH